MTLLVVQDVATRVELVEGLEAAEMELPEVEEIKVVAAEGMEAVGAEGMVMDADRGLIAVAAAAFARESRDKDFTW